MTWAPRLLRSFVVSLEVFRPALTQPSYEHLITLVVGWVLTTGKHAVTEALVNTDVACRRHHEAYHRFFSRGTWSPDELGRLLFGWIVGRMANDAPIRIAVDDTLAPKKGAEVFGIGSHLDAVRSTRRRKIFCFGHCWVMVAVLVTVPFSRRPWALPVLFRLYRNKKECAKKEQPYSKKTELAREMLDVVVGWANGRRIELAADSAYCNDTVTRGLPDSVVLFGSMRPDAVLTALPAPTVRTKKGGRPRLRGDGLPKPEQLAKDERERWQTCSATLYGRKTKVRYKDCFAQWYRACGVRLLRVVVVAVPHGAIPIRVFFCTDSSLSVREILESYAGRWSIETCFRNLKQLLGFADSSARKKESVQRTAPFVGMTYTFLVMWFTDQVYSTGSELAEPPVRPWYRHKQGLSFGDVLRAAQRVVAPLDVLDPGNGLANLHHSPGTASNRASAAKRAA